MAQVHHAPSNGQQRRRILYLMHVDWSWIKQRPHFLAEQLATEHDVLVFHRLCVTNRRQLTPNTTKVSGLPLLPVPWIGNAGAIGRRLQRQWISLAARSLNPDLLWITHPSLLAFLPARLQDLPLVYDCMDDALSFRASAERVTALCEWEHRVVERAEKILCSSAFLRQLLIERYGPQLSEKTALVRNGLSAASLATRRACWPRTAGLAGSKAVKVAYIGTISEWFDFPALIAALEHNPTLEFHLAGPIVVAKPPQHKRVHYHGAIPHEQLVTFAEQFDAYVMPFRVTQLVEAVDPVKLYEYIGFGREVISVRYQEVERFSPLVHLYEGKHEFVSLMRKLTSGALAQRNSLDASCAFLKQNTWEARMRLVSEILASIY